MFLCTESASEDEKDEDPENPDQPPVAGSNAAAWGSIESTTELDPAPKKQKLHFGGLNLKKKKTVNKPPVEDFSSAPDTFDEWWFLHPTAITILHVPYLLLFNSPFLDQQIGYNGKTNQEGRYCR